MVTEIELFPCPTCSGETRWEGESCGGCYDDVFEKAGAWTYAALAADGGRGLRLDLHRCRGCGRRGTLTSLLFGAEGLDAVFCQCLHMQRVLAAV